MRKTTIVAMSVLVLMSLAQCECHVSTANLGDVRMARDEAGEQRTTEFGPMDTFWCVLELRNAPEGTTVEARWKVVEAEGEPAGKLIDAVKIEPGNKPVQFSLKHDQPFPPGRYEVELLLDGEVERTVPFTVTAGG